MKPFITDFNQRAGVKTRLIKTQATKYRLQRRQVSLNLLDVIYEENLNVIKSNIFQKKLNTWKIMICNGRFSWKIIL